MSSSFLQAEDKTDTTFHPSWWCRGAHLQTICGSVFRKKAQFFYRRERFDLPDGDYLDLDWYDGDPKEPTIFILHGLAGNSESPDIKNFVQKIHDRNWNAVVMNARGQSGEANRLVFTNHAGRSQDVQWAVFHVLFTHQIDRMYVVGFSIGANMLLKWLGEDAKDVSPAVKKAVAVSTAFDLEKVADLLDSCWFSRNVYVRSMLSVLKPLALHKEEKFPGSLNVKAVEKAETFHVYDREVTAKLNGFEDEKEYWTKSSSVHYLKDIKVPTLIIHAANDPFLPVDYFPFSEIKSNPNISLLMTGDGGHLGFVTGKHFGKPEPWLESRILEYFDKDENVFYEEFPAESKPVKP